MKSEKVIRALERALSGSFEDAEKMVSLLGHDMRAAGKPSLALKLDRIIDSSKRERGRNKEIRPLIPMIGAQNLLTEVEPKRELSTVILDDASSSTVDILMNEWSRREDLAAHNLTPRSRILISGPSGSGKSSLAEALAKAIEMPFYRVRTEQLVNSHLGETGKEIEKLGRAIADRDCVIFFDEFDTLGASRKSGGVDGNASGEMRRAVNALLVMLDSLTPRTVVIAATNLPDILDDAFLRRFEVNLHLTAPTDAGLRRFVEVTGGDWGSSEHLRGHLLEHLASVASCPSYAHVELRILAARRAAALSPLPRAAFMAAVRDPMKLVL